MSIQLKLDTNALMTLFPEGSEARLELQQAVLNEAAKRSLKGITQQELVKAISPAVTKIKKELISEYGELKYLQNRWELIPSTEFKKAVRELLHNEIFSFLGKEMTDYLENRFTYMMDAIKKEAIGYAQNMVNKTYEEAFQQRLAQINKLSQGTK
mgnify:CR=1 FL=1